MEVKLFCKNSFHKWWSTYLPFICYNHTILYKFVVLNDNVIFEIITIISLCYHNLVGFS